MSKLTVYTSGSTAAAKEVTHDWEAINNAARLAVDEWKLTKDSIVLNILPHNTIGFWSIGAYPAVLAGATLINMVFDPYEYIKMFNKYRPTHSGMINRHYEVLSKTKGWEELDMSCMEYMTVGSDMITEEYINALKSKGVKKVGNWYGMTEFPPPVMIAYDGFNFDKVAGSYNVEFAEDGECIINGVATGDVFTKDRRFSHRKTSSNEQRKTWKTSI